MNRLQRDGVDVILGTEYLRSYNYTDNSSSDDSDDDDSDDSEDDRDENEDQEYSVYSDSEDDCDAPIVIDNPHGINYEPAILDSDDDDTDYSEGMESFDEEAEEESDESSLALNDDIQDDNAEVPAKRQRRD